MANELGQTSRTPAVTTTAAGRPSAAPGGSGATRPWSSSQDACCTRRSAAQPVQVGRAGARDPLRHALVTDDPGGVQVTGGHPVLLQHRPSAHEALVMHAVWATPAGAASGYRHG
jgi:hypothetical protein